MDTRRAAAQAPRVQSLVKTPTPDIEASASFYTRLGWTKVPTGDETAAFTDGGAIVMIDPARTARTTVVLRGPDAAELHAVLETLGKVVDKDGVLYAADPSGVLLALDPRPALDVPACEPSTLGAFMGLSLEALDPARVVAFWEALGWQIAQGGPTEGWTMLTRDGAFGVSVMGLFSCPHLFFSPGLTYFNSGKNPEVIAKIRAADIPIAEEITVFNDAGEVDNVVLRDPGGTGFFVFND